MKVNDPNLSSAGATGAAHASETARAKAAERSAVAQAASTSQAAGGDDVHLSELVRSLRSLAAESPERQAKIEHLARAYASGSYKVDAEATASAIIQESSNGRARS
jgi:flagellar biosynthesis anti-sigma factor FlgM